jgi:hypothetical protein
LIPPSGPNTVRMPCSRHDTTSAMLTQRTGWSAKFAPRFNEFWGLMQGMSLHSRTSGQ